MSTEYEYFNAHRLYQATFLRSRMADDGLGLIHHRVLEVLARKMARASIPRTIIERDTCFPSLETLAEETTLSDKSVRNAIRRLVEKKYITISKIKGHKLRKASDKMTWDANRYHLVAETWDTVSSPFMRGDAAKSALLAGPPLNLPASPAEAAVLAELDNKPAPKDYKAEKKVEGTDELLALLHEHFPDHPSLTGPTAKNIATDCIKSCLAAADGDSAISTTTLMWCFADPTIKAAVASSKHLGGYIKQSFPGWLANCRKVYDDDVISTFCDGTAIEYDPEVDVDRTVPLDQRYLRGVIGAHLLDLSYDMDTRIMTAVITPAYKIANLLSRFTVKPVSPDLIPPAVADEETLNQCRSLSMDEIWVAGLRDAGDPIDYLLWSLADPTPDEAPEEAADAIYDDEQVDDVEVRAEEFWTRETREPMMQRVSPIYSS